MKSSTQGKILTHQFVLNGIIESYQKLINSNSLINDLIDNKENYECFLINHTGNIKLRNNNSDPSINYQYDLEVSKKLVCDQQYCENWLEIVKSYLFSVGVDIEDKENNNIAFDLEAVKKSIDKLTIVISSLKLIAMITSEHDFNEQVDRKFIDQVVEIYIACFKAFINSDNRYLEKYFYDLEDGKSGTQLEQEYQNFCLLNFKENAFKGIFGELEDEIVKEIELDKNQDSISQEFKTNQNISIIDQLNNGIKELIESIKANQKLNLKNLISVFESSIIAKFSCQELLNSINDNYKKQFIEFINLYFLKNGINLNNNSSVLNLNQINQEELSSVISSMKILALYFKDKDKNFYDSIANLYRLVYGKYLDYGLLDQDSELSYCLYANETGISTQAGEYYLKNSNEGIFFEIENNLDQQRLSVIIENNIKKFDEKTIKFYQSPYIDFRLERDKQNNCIIQLLFDATKTNFDAVAKDFAVNPQDISIEQKKVVNDGSLISFTHQQVANYLGINQGEELNQTLLTIHELAQKEAKEFNDFIKNDDYNNDAKNTQIYPDNVTSIDHDDQLNSSSVRENRDNLSTVSNQQSLDSAQDFSKDQAQDFDKSEFLEMYNFYIENKEKIANALNDNSIKQTLFFLALNPDLKLDFTSNPKLEDQVRNQFKFLFKKGYNENNLKLFATFIARGELKDWQKSNGNDLLAKGYEGSYILPHDFSGQFLGVRNPANYNSEISKVGEFLANQKILNMTMIDFLYQDSCYTILKNLILQNFKLSFEYIEPENIFSPKNLILIADNGLEREKIYNFFGLVIDNKNLGNEQEILNIRNQITNSNGDIVVSNQIALYLYGVKSIQEADLVARKIESFVNANYELCNIFKVNHNKNLRILLNIVNESQEFVEDEDETDDKKDFAYA